MLDTPQCEFKCWDSIALGPYYAALMSIWFEYPQCDSERLDKIAVGPYCVALIVNLVYVNDERLFGEKKREREPFLKI